MYNKLVYDYTKSFLEFDPFPSTFEPFLSTLERVQEEILKALKDQEEVMELDWAILSQISDVSTLMWGEYYQGEDVPEARAFLLRMSRPEKEVVLEDYL